MSNRDERFNRFLNDAKFAHLVKLIESLFYSDQRITYENVLDAAYVARVRYVEQNPSAVLVVQPNPQSERMGE